LQSFIISFFYAFLLIRLLSTVDPATNMYF
jgi:hypothetical protein